MAAAFEKFLLTIFVFACQSHVFCVCGCVHNMALISLPKNIGLIKNFANTNTQQHFRTGLAWK